MVQYYFTCPRELWFFSRGIAFEEDENILIGRLIHDEAFQREWKEVLLDDVRLDVVMKEENLTVVEIKKSSRLKEPSKWQLKYYLYLLKKAGIEAKGIVSYPEEGTREEVELTEDDVLKLEEALRGIEEIVSLQSPPPPVKKPYCKRCSYRDFCWV